jgi:hypothetical protein
MYFVRAVANPPWRVSFNGQCWLINNDTGNIILNNKYNIYCKNVLSRLHLSGLNFK